MMNALMFIVISSMIASLFYSLGFFSGKGIEVVESIGLQTGSKSTFLCKHCGGRGTLGGSFYVYESCPHCKGSGHNRKVVKDMDKEKVLMLLKSQRDEMDMLITDLGGYHKPTFNVDSLNTQINDYFRDIREAIEEERYDFALRVAESGGRIVWVKTT